MKMSPMSEISSISSTSTTAQRRKIKKPLIEKRRRLRINQSLANLKSLVLEATKKDENCFPKMEKADILEMTVAYMKTMKHRLPAVSTSTAMDSDDQMRTYLSGFQECAMQVCSFLMDEATVSAGGAELRGKLTRHLSGYFHRVESDLQGQTERRGVTGSFGKNTSGAESPKERSGSCEDRLYSSSSSEKSSSSLVNPALSPLSTAPPPPSNFKTELPRTGGAVYSPGNPVPFSTILRNQDPPPAAKHSSQSTAITSSVSRSRYTSSSHHPVVSFQNNSPLIHQYPDSLSPKKAADFPSITSTLSSPIPVAMVLPKSALNPFSPIHRMHQIPAFDSNSSVVWRPW